MIKINYKILTFISFFTLLYFAFSFYYVSQTDEKLHDQKYHEIVTGMKQHLDTLINEKREAILLVALSLSQNSDIKRILLNNTRSELHLAHFSEKLKEDSSLKHVWFQLIDKNGISYCRSWTKKRGDNLLKSRLEISEMIKSPRIISLISTGKFSMTFKSIVPIYNNGKLLGIIETIAPFNSIVKKMKQKSYNTLILIDKSYKAQLNHALSTRFIKDYYIATQIYDPTLKRLFKNKYKEQMLKINNYIVDLEENLLISSYTLKDIKGDDMGHFILSINLDKIDFSDVEKTVTHIILTLLFILLIIIGFSYYIYVIQYKRFIERQNEKLENDVNVKTKELYHSAHHDALTDLPNRVLFTDKLNEAINFAQRREMNIFVLFLDLDRFKEVNDTYGHDVGDQLLQSVTQRLQENLRSIDVIARIGGDEFTILIQDIQYNDMLIVAEKITHSMKEPFYIKGIKLNTTFSIGISTYPQDGTTTQELLKNADIAMYQAKEDGKNQYKFYNKEMSDRAHARVVLENDIKSALENGEFEAYFQPKVNALSQKVIGLEALIRWNHPTKGLIFPDQFINFAEEVGLIIEIDNYMRRETMRITKEWLQKGLEFGKVSFNASTLELESEGFVTQIKSLIEEMEYDSSKLELEILESQSIQNREKMMITLQEIRDLGLSVSIDDFGTGYSSLSYLKKLPIDKLKIDRSFIIDVPHDSASVALVRTVITLAKNLNLEIIAEGVEEKEQVEFLIKEGCENIQGYYYSKPIKADQIVELLIKGVKK